MEHKILSISFILAALAILFVSLSRPYNVGAQYYQQGEVKKFLSVDKKVRSIEENEYFNNIDRTHRIFYENDVVEYSISIENTGNETLNNINVVDFLPKNISLIFYPGIFNKDANTINWTIDQLNAAEVKTYLIRYKIVDTKGLGLIQGNFVKLTNIAEAKTDNISDRDEANIYLGSGTVPKTGDPSLVIKTAIVISSTLVGFALRKFARGY